MATYARLRAVGITPGACLDHGMTTSLPYSNPDGNRVELQVDNVGDWAARKLYMQTSPDFAANPIGVFFDPDAMLAAHESGTSFDVIHARATAGEYPPTRTPDLGLPG